MSALEIGQALNRLPDPESFPSDEIQQWSTVPSMGGLLLAFRRHRHKQGKTYLTFWVATKADRVSGLRKFYDPKTKYSRRIVEVPAGLLGRLKPWRLACPKGEHDLVFPNQDGKPQRADLLIKAGI